MVMKIITIKKIKEFYAPPDLWNRRNDTGKSAAEIFWENGVLLTKCSADRVNGWLSVKEWIKVYDSIDEQTGENVQKTKLHVFSNCINLINNLPEIQRDDKNPNDCATEPHELTHITDSLRHFCISRPVKTEIKKINKEQHFNFEVERPPQDDYGEEIVVV